MKQIILLSLFLFSLLDSALAQEHTKEDRIVNTFTNIEVSKGIDVFISQGDTTGVVVETAEELMHSVVTEVSGGTLKLTINERNRSLAAKKTQIFVHVTLPKLYALSVNGNSNAIILSEFMTNRLELAVSASGQININNRLAIEDRLDINSKTKGKVISKGNITAESAGITIASNGNVNLLLTLNHKLECTAIGNSTITLTGGAEEALLSAKSQSELKLKNFKLKRVNVVATSSAIIHITVEEFLAATAADRAIINYSGKPTTVSKETTTGGKIK